MFEDMLKRETEIESPNQEELSLTGDAMAQEIRSTNGRCIELPENPSYPLLVKLFLQDNTNLTDIPPSFFEHMPNLEVLDMSNTSVSTFPWSISKLLKLQELLLKRCKMLTELPPEIGSLTNLRVLDLEETELICLPEQIRCLLQLKCLKFSLYKYADHHKKGSVISKETLSKLCSLEELSIKVDPECEWWDAEVEAVIDDLGKLGNLETLKLYLPTYQLFKKILELKRIERDGMPLLFSSLSNFRLIVGRHEDPIMSCVPRVLQEEFMKLDKCLKYVNLSDYLDVEVLQHVRALFIHRPWSSTQALSELDLTRMNNLTFFLLAECDSMRTIIDGHQLEYGIGNYILGSVYYLGIHYMKNLHSICEGMYSQGCLSNLKILAIHTCPKLTTIFNNGFLENLVLLEELVIKDCINLKSLVDPSYSYPLNSLLPSLRKISLLHLPELTNISSGQYIASNLETMVIYNCPKLESLHPLEKCSKNVKVIKGESKWWESKNSGWSIASVFVALKDDDEDYIDGDELTGAVHLSLARLSQATEKNEGMEIKDNRAEQPKVEPPVQALTSTYPSSSSSKMATSPRNPIKVSVRSVSKVFGTCFTPRNNLDEPPSDAYSAGTERRTGSNYGSSSITLARLKKPRNFEFTMSEITKATGNFSPSLKIGQGGFGGVYKAQLEDGTLVVVKRCRQTISMYRGRAFQRAISTLANIEHRNLVKYYGYSEHKDERVLINVTEFVPNGTLREHLDGLHGNVLDFGARLDIGIDVANAIDYLHGGTGHHIIHGDIKSSNILLTHTLSAKVADFDKDFIARRPGYLLTHQLTQESDVYSFGVLLVELVTGRRSIEAERASEERETAIWVRKKLHEGDALVTLDPNLEKSPANKMAIEMAVRLSLQCLAPYSDSRPSMKECASFLYKIRHAYSAEPERRTGSNYGSSSMTLARLKEPSNFEFTMSEIKKATGNFSPSLKIGQGGFGEVYKAQLEDGTLVVVKRCRQALYDEHLGVEFQSEIKNLTKIEHNNLVKYYGYLEHEDERVLVLEFVPNGTLREHLDCLHGKVLDFGARLNIGIDVANALSYLHMWTNPHIVHGNIKSSNVLLTHTLSAKVADFGFSGMENYGEFIRRHMMDYLDPKYSLTHQLTQESDVSSFGVLLVELVTGRRPIGAAKRVSGERVTVQWVRKKFGDGNALMTLDPRLEKSAANEMAIVKVLKLSFQCLAPDQKNRRDIKECSHILHEIRDEYMNPSKRHE